MFLPTSPENAQITETLATMLAAIPMGEMITYASLCDAVHRDVQKRHRHLLENARERTEKALGCIFEPIRGEGIKRLPASECPEVGLAAIQRVRRTAKRGEKRLSRINSNSLSQPEQKRVISYRSMLGALSMMADGNKARTVAAVVDPAKPIPPADILAMFSK